MGSSNRFGRRMMWTVGVVIATALAIGSSPGSAAAPPKPKPWADAVCFGLVATKTDLLNTLSSASEQMGTGAPDSQDAFVTTWSAMAARLDLLLADLDAAGTPKHTAPLIAKIRAKISAIRDYYARSAATVQATDPTDLPAFIAAVSSIATELRSDTDLGYDFPFVLRLAKRAGNPGGGALLHNPGCRSLSSA